MNTQCYKQLLILLTFQIFLLTGCNNFHTDKKYPHAVKGVIDLSGWNFEKEGPVDLTGEWEFYWQQHLSPDIFSRSTAPSKTGFMRVPEFWNNYEFDGVKLSGKGFATFRLKVLLNKKKEPLALRLMEISTAYTLFVNGRQMASAGVAGPDREATVPKQFRQVVDFEYNADQLEIILHVSNFHHKKGGVWEIIQLGSKKDLHQSQARRLGFDLFLFGSIVIMGLYHLGLFALRRKDPSPLYFSIFCFLIALRLISTGERVLIHMYSNISWQSLMKLEYLSFYLAVPAFSFFMWSLFPKFSKRILYIFGMLGIAFSFVVLVTQPGFFFAH